MALRIRRFEERDLKSLHELLSDEKVMRFIEPPFTIEQTRYFLGNAGLTEDPLIYAVEDENGVFIGYVIYHDYDDNSKEIGWVIRPQFWGEGYASKLTEQLVEKSCSERKSCIIECSPEQHATKHIAEKHGFTYLGQYDGLDVFKLDHKEAKMLKLHEPTLEDLWFRQQMMADPETMSYNHAWGGTIPFPEDEWKDWYDCWITNNKNHRYYRYLKNTSEQFVGEIAYHYDEERCVFIADVIVYAPHRGNGYGGRGLELLCAVAKENGVTVLYDDIAVDNPSVELFLRHGFIEEYRTDEIIMLKKEL